jgi:DNA-binding FadR family transcriptional regulator
MMNVLSVPHPVFRRIRGGNAFEETVERLLQAVKLGQVRPGDRLPSERELALRLGISRVTLREAIRVLAQEGYLASRRGRSGGTFVLPTADWRQDTRDVRATPGDLDDELTDALVLRQVLEPAAVELAARRAHPAETVTTLREMLAEEQSVEVTDYRPIDSRLHVALADLAGSPSLTAAVADVRMRLNDLLDMIPLLPPNIEHSTEQHRRVVEAIVSGNPKAARQAMEKHLEGTASLLRGFLG